MRPRITGKNGIEHSQQLTTSFTRIVYLWPDLKTTSLTGVVYIWFDRRITALTRSAWLVCLARFSYHESHMIFINLFIFSSPTA